jgi:hypothetical protein
VIDVIVLVDKHHSRSKGVGNELCELRTFVAETVGRMLAAELTSNIADHLPPDDASQARLPPKAWLLVRELRG